MKKNISYLVLIIAVTAFCASGVQAGEVAQKRTWTQYAQQKAAANNLLASKDERAAANAKLQLGRIQHNEAMAMEEVDKERLKNEKQARALQELADTKAKIAAANARLGVHTSAIEDAKQQRIQARAAVSGAPAAPVVPAGSSRTLTRQQSMRNINSTALVVSGAASGIVKVGVDAAASKIGPNFAAYLNDKTKRAEAIAEVKANAAAKGIEVTPGEIGNLKTAFLNAKARGQATVDVVPAFTR